MMVLLRHHSDTAFQPADPARGLWEGLKVARCAARCSHGQTVAVLS
jgi:hypothetical protein